LQRQTGRRGSWDRADRRPLPGILPRCGLRSVEALQQASVRPCGSPPSRHTSTQPTGAASGARDAQRAASAQLAKAGVPPLHPHRHSIAAVGGRHLGLSVVQPPVRCRGTASRCSLPPVHVHTSRTAAATSDHAAGRANARSCRTAHGTRDSARWPGRRRGSHAGPGWGTATSRRVMAPQGSSEPQAAGGRRPRLLVVLPPGVVLDRLGGREDGSGDGPSRSACPDDFVGASPG
jgi:hypothetical protein